jgi:hypothetical protein
MPNTTASMITAPSTATGRSEKSGARMSRVASTRPPVISDAACERAPADSFSELAERLVNTEQQEPGRREHPAALTTSDADAAEPPLSPGRFSGPALCRTGGSA